MLKKLVAAGRWIGKHWAISTAVVLIIAIAVTTIVCWNFFGKEKKVMVPIYVTVTGLGEGKDMEKRELLVEEYATVAEIFSLEYPEIYKDFQQPLVQNNEFWSFMGVRKNASKRFYVKIEDQYNEILNQAYTYKGCNVYIDYR